MIQKYGMPSPPPVSFDSWPRRPDSENIITLLLPGRDRLIPSLAKGRLASRHNARKIDATRQVHERVIYVVYTV